MNTQPLYPGFTITEVRDFKDGTYGVTLRGKTDALNVITHTGKFNYLKKTLLTRYGVEFTK